GPDPGVRLAGEVLVLAGAAEDAHQRALQRADVAERGEEAREDEEDRQLAVLARLQEPREDGDGDEAERQDRGGPRGVDQRVAPDPAAEQDEDVGAAAGGCAGHGAVTRAYTSAR